MEMIKKRFSTFQTVGIIVTLVALLTGCGPGNVTVPTSIPDSQPPEVNLILDPDISDVLAGQTVTLAIEASGQGIQIKWSVIRGTLSASEGPAVVYTPPNTPGKDTVTVEVSTVAGTTIKNVSFNVIVPPTDTPPPVDTPMPTAAPEPIVCNHPSVTKNLFPQLKDENGQFPMYGPLGDSHVLCQAVYDIVHTPGGMAIHVKYENAGTNFGWWGIATPNGYDASQYKQLCFWAYEQVPNQSFRFKMKDTTKQEKGIVTTLEKTNEWQQICADLADFSNLGVHVDKMDNVNLGFEQPTGSAEIWIADFQFE